MYVLKMIHKDERGELHSLKNLPFTPKEVLISKNEKYAFRGLHLSPYAKFIYVSEGHICDTYIDIHTNVSKTIELKKGDSLYIPQNTAHSFYCYKQSIIIYFLEDYYDEKTTKKIYYNAPELNLQYNFSLQKLIMSQSDIDANYLQTYKYLVLGGSGYLGSNLLKYINNYLVVTTRLSDTSSIKQHIIKSKCSYVICSAGISGKPTTQWCEDNEKETYEVNYLDMLKLMQLCDECKVHLTIFGSGLVYSGQTKQLYTEDDDPDCADRIYSYYRVALENIIRRNMYTNILYLRIMYPCTFDGNPKCFLSKMKQRSLEGTVHDVSVPITIVPDLFPKIPYLLDINTTGILNFVNEENISLERLLKLCKIPIKGFVNAIDGKRSNSFGLCNKHLCNLVEVNNIQDIIHDFDK